MRLSRQQRKKLKLALIDAFPTSTSLEQMLLDELGKSLRVIAGEGSLQDIASTLIQVAESQGWIEDLVHAACESNPGNPKLQTIAQELLSLSAAVPSTQQQKNRRDLLDAVKFEVNARLEQSLHNAILIELGKELQPKQVKRPWDAEVKIGVKPPKPIPDTTKIIDIFTDSEIAGKLLILGEPGSGKTTTQLELARDLIIRFEEQPDYPIPVLLNLSSWQDERQSITDWLIAELKSKYHVPKPLGQEWLQNQQLLPLLDGLDEVKQELQESCIKSINQFLQEECSPQYLVVCSRREEYLNHSTKLVLNNAIYLQPLTNNQICDYLNDINRTDLQRTIENDSNLLELIRTPFFLSVTILAFQEISIESWQQLSSTKNRIKRLLDAYVTRMLERDINSKAYANPKKYPDTTQTRLWLVWLAKQMQTESKTEFLIERIQPFYLTKPTQIWSFRLLTGLFYGLFVGLSFGLCGGLSFGLFCGVNGGFIGMISMAVSNKIEVFETVKWSWKKVKDKLLFSLFSQILSAIIFGVISKGLINALLFGLTFGVIIGLISGLSGGLSAIEDIKTKRHPNQGIRTSAFNAVRLGLIGGLIGGLVGELFNELTMELIDTLPSRMTGGLISKMASPLFGGLIGSVSSSLTCGGGGCIEHLALRLTLYFNHYISWNYARFLDYSTERLFLQRVGGRYRFIHKMVQDHFANMG